MCARSAARACYYSSLCIVGSNKVYDIALYVYCFTNVYSARTTSPSSDVGFVCTHVSITPYADAMLLAIMIVLPQQIISELRRLQVEGPLEVEVQNALAAEARASETALRTNS
jgi:hypothetical protein